MNSDIEIREMNESEINDVVLLHNKYENDKVTPQMWHWEYKGMYPKKYVFTIIKNDDRILGTQGMIPIFLNINGKKIFTGKSESTLLDTELRGKGAFKKIYEVAIQQCKNQQMVCLWGFTKATKAFEKKAKFRIYKNVMKWAILPIKYHTVKEATKNLNKSKSSFKSIFFPIKIIAGKIYSSIKRSQWKSKLKKIQFNYELTSVLKSMNDLEIFYRTIRKKNKNIIHIHQDEKYINWRIYNNPFNRKLTFFVYSNKTLMGYLYLTIREQIIEITDFTFINEKVGLYLMKFFLDEVTKNQIGLAIYSGNIKNSVNQEVFRLLENFGFIIVKRSNEFVLRNMDYNTDESIYEIENWYLTDLWSEGV